MLSALVSGKYKNLRDKDDNIFMDRNPDIFQKVLDFLRNGYHVESIHRKSQLVREFKYYGFGVDNIWGIGLNGSDSDSYSESYSE